MKKMLLNFAEQMLSKDQMRKVKGGCDGGAACSAGACLTHSDCSALNCTTCSSNDGKTGGSCS